MFIASEERKIQAKEYEQKLMETHKDKWTSFQYKLWAEMLVCGTHTSVEDPPSASMFSRDTKRSSNPTLNDSVVKGMMTAMNSLCQALVPKETSSVEKRTLLSSPMKKAELRGTYMKQLNELRQPHDSGILDQEEYEEQRSDLVGLMRQLKK